MYYGYGSHYDHENTGETRSKKARTIWDEDPIPNTQYSYGNTASTRSTSDLVTYPGFSSMITKTQSPTVSANSQMSQGDSFYQGPSSHSARPGHVGGSDSSGFGKTENYGESSYSNLLKQNAAFRTQGQSSSSITGSSDTWTGYGRRETSSFREDSDSRKGKRSYYPSDSQEGSRYSSHGSRYREEEDSRFRRGESGHHGSTGFHAGTRENSRSARSREFRPKQNEYGSSDWRQGLGNTGGHGRSSHTESMSRYQGPRHDPGAPFETDNDADFVTDLTLRMAAEIQQQKQGSVDVKKILKVMKLVDDMEKSTSLGQGAAMGMMGQDAGTGMMGQGAGTGMMGQGAGNRMMGQGAGTGMMGQGARTQMMGQGAGTGMMGQGAGTGMMGQGAGTGMMDQGARTGMMDQDVSTGMMGQGARTGMMGQGAGTGMMGQGARTGMMDQDASTGMMGQDTGTGMMGQGAGAGMMGQGAGTGMMGQGTRTRMMGQGAGTGMMGQGAGAGMMGQGAGTGMMGQGARTRMMGQGAGPGMMGQGARTRMMGQGAGTGMIGQDARTGMMGQSAGNGMMGRGADTGMMGQDAGIGMMSQGAITGMMGQGAGTGIMGQGANTGLIDLGAGMGMMGQGAGTGMMGQGAGIGMMGQGAGMGMMGQGAGTGMMGQGAGRSMMGQGAGRSMMGQGAGRNMMGQGAGMDMMGRMSGLGMDMAGQGIKNRPRSSESQQFSENFGMNRRQPFRKGIPGRQRFGDSAKQKMFQERGKLRSLNHIDVSMSGNNKKSTVYKPNSGHQSHGKSRDQGVESLTLLQRMSKFIEFLKTEDITRNAINVLDVAVDRCKLDMQKDFKFETFLSIGNREMVSGRLYLRGAFLARSVGMNRREVKNECYAKALHVLTTQSAKTILKQQDPTKEKLAQKMGEEMRRNAAEREKAELKDEKKAELKDEKKAETKDEKKAETRDEKETDEPEDPDKPEENELEKKLRKLVNHLKSLRQRATDCDNKVTFLNDAITESGCELDYSYTEEETKCCSGIAWLIGKLKIDDILIGFGTGPSTKSATNNTYQKALNFLLKHPVFKIMQGVHMEDKDVVPGFELISERHSGLPNASTEEKLANMMILVSNISVGKPIQVEIDNTARKAKLVLTLLFKRGESESTRTVTMCELYLDNIFISVGEGFKRAEAMSQAYQEALTVLSSGSSDVIFHDFKRLTREDAKGVLEVLEVWAKGGSKTMFFSNTSKVAKMKAAFMHLGKEELSEINPDKDEMIIVENSTWSQDRYHKAYDILQASAVANSMTLQGKTTHFAGAFKCELYLQREKIAEASHPNSNFSSTLAAAEYLFKLYQSQPTIKAVYRDDLDTMISYETLKAKADKLKEESGDTGTDDFFYIPADALTKKKGANKNEEKMDVDEETEEQERNCESPSSTLPVNKWLKQVTEEIIENFAKTETLNEIMFGGEFPTGDMMQVRLTAEKYKLYSRRKDHHHKGTYFVIFQKYFPDKMLEILNRNGGKCGKYSLVPKEDLPKPGDFKRGKSK